MDFQVGQKTTQNSLLVRVNISNTVLTPLTCSSLINEIFKGLLYQKSQIPYPYSWMKMVVDKKRKHSEDSVGLNQRVNISAANHFHVVSSTYDALENVMLAITSELRDCVHTIKEVTFLFGPTPQCPKEIFTIDISSLTKAHIERNHAAGRDKSLMKILRNLFLSEVWLANSGGSYNCTNTYVYLKKDIVGAGDCCKSQTAFVPARPITFSSRIKHVKIYLESDDENISTNCCQNLTIFEDGIPLEEYQQNISDIVEDCKEKIVWYQFQGMIKGFKDCFINKESVSTLW